MYKLQIFAYNTGAEEVSTDNGRCGNGLTWPGMHELSGVVISMVWCRPELRYKAHNPLASKVKWAPKFGKRAKSEIREQRAAWLWHGSSQFFGSLGLTKDVPRAIELWTEAAACCGDSA